MVEVVPTALGIDAPLIGAAELALSGIIANPAHDMGDRCGAGSRGDELGELVHGGVADGPVVGDATMLEGMTRSQTSTIWAKLWAIMMIRRPAAALELRIRSRMTCSP